MKRILSLIYILLVAQTAFAQVVADSLSQARLGLCSSVLGDKVFFAGSGAPGSDRVDIYDNTSGTWSQHTLLKMISGPVCRVLNDKAYFIGTSAIYPDSVRNHLIEYYDQNTGTWGTDTVPYYIPLEYNYFDVEVHGQDLVFMNGTNNPQVYTPYLFMLNTQSHTWNAVAVPDSLQSATISVLKDEVVWTSSALQPVQYLVRYNLLTQTILLDSMPTMVDGPYLYSAGNKTFIYGGHLPFSAFTFHQFLIYDHPSRTFDVIGLGLGGSPQVLQYGNKIIFGGSGAYSGLYSYNVGSVLFYDLAGDSLSYGYMSKSRNYYGLTANCGKFYLAGGFSYNQNNPGTIQDTIDIFDTLNYARTTGLLYQGRHSLNAESVGQNMLFAGGYYSTSIYYATPLVEFYNCLTVGESEMNTAADEIKIYPVPANNELNIQTKSVLRYSVSDITGRNLFNGKTIAGISTISLEGIPPGAYFISFTNEENGENSRQIFIRQ